MGDTTRDVIREFRKRAEEAALEAWVKGWREGEAGRLAALIDPEDPDAWIGAVRVAGELDLPFWMRRKIAAALGIPGERIVQAERERRIGERDDPEAREWQRQRAEAQAPAGLRRLAAEPLRREHLDELVGRYGPGFAVLPVAEAGYDDEAQWWRHAGHGHLSLIAMGEKGGGGEEPGRLLLVPRKGVGWERFRRRVEFRARETSARRFVLIDDGGAVELLGTMDGGEARGGRFARFGPAVEAAFDGPGGGGRRWFHVKKPGGFFEGISRVHGRGELLWIEGRGSLIAGDGL